MNRAESLGPAMSPMETVFCNGHRNEIDRDGFAVFERRDSEESSTPKLPETAKIECGLNGPVCQDDNTPGHKRGKFSSVVA